MLTVDWKAVNGAAVKKRIMHLQNNNEGVYICPVIGCLHIGFKSSRGVRKHINGIHPWFYYFDEQPPVSRTDAIIQTKEKIKSSTHNVPAFSLDTGLGKQFLEWLQTPCGGGKTLKEGICIGRRAMKFLMSALGEPQLESVLKEDYIDCCVGSPTIVMNFLKVITEDWSLRASGALPYMKAISDLLDFRKANGVSDDVLRNFAVNEVYIRRGKENLAKKKKIEYGRNLDLETLISRNSWATIEEMLQVIPYHTPKFHYVLKKCKAVEDRPTVSELSFATRFVVTFLFLRVKCTRPMTYQFVTVDMINHAKTNGGFIDQTAFKTNEKYVFDTLVLTVDVMQVLDCYITTVRPLLSPTCEYLLLTCNGTQYTALGTAMSLLVHQAIGKSVNPTRYRQIIESQSALQLEATDRETISKDQKHSSQVAKRIYQKRLSREVAIDAKLCMRKITGTVADEHTQVLALSLTQNNSESATSSAEKTSVEENADIPPPSRDNANTVNNEDEVYDEISDDVRTENEVITLSGEENDSVAAPLRIVEKTIPLLTVQSLPLLRQHSSTRVTGEDIEAEVVNTARQDIDNHEKRLEELEVKKEEVEKEVPGSYRLLRFTWEEDKALKDGITKHGLGRWKEILRDDDLKFHPSRTRDSIRMRADTIGLSKKSKKNRKTYNVRRKVSQ